MSTVSVAFADYSDPEAGRLRAALEAEMNERYADYSPDYGEAQRSRSEQFGDGRGAYVLAAAGGPAIGCGGVRRMDEATAEIKNVYVLPEWRGRRVATAIMDALEGWARGAGCTRLILETGERQSEALALYDRLGFARIPAYPPWDNELSVCLAKPLD